MIKILFSKERYCMKCHKIKGLLEFKSPSIHFRVAGKCRGCALGKNQGSRTFTNAVQKSITKLHDVLESLSKR